MKGFAGSQDLCEKLTKSNPQYETKNRNTKTNKWDAPDHTNDRQKKRCSTKNRADPRPKKDEGEFARGKKSAKSPRPIVPHVKVASRDLGIVTRVRALNGSELGHTWAFVGGNISSHLRRVRRLTVQPSESPNRSPEGTP